MWRRWLCWPSAVSGRGLFSNWHGYTITMADGLKGSVTGRNVDGTFTNSSAGFRALTFVFDESSGTLSVYASNGVGDFRNQYLDGSDSLQSATIGHAAIKTPDDVFMGHSKLTEILVDANKILGETKPAQVQNVRVDRTAVSYIFGWLHFL